MENRGWVVGGCRPVAGVGRAKGGSVLGWGWSRLGRGERCSDGFDRVPSRLPQKTNLDNDNLLIPEIIISIRIDSLFR